MSQVLPTPPTQTASQSAHPSPATPQYQPQSIEDVNMSNNNIPEDMTIEGNLKCRGNLTVEGQVSGEVECGGHLVVGENANIAQGFKAASVMICGEVDCRWSQMKDGKPRQL